MHTRRFGIAISYPSATGNRHISILPMGKQLLERTRIASSLLVRQKKKIKHKQTENKLP